MRRILQLMKIRTINKTGISPVENKKIKVEDILPLSKEEFETFKNKIIPIVIENDPRASLWWLRTASVEHPEGIYCGSFDEVEVDGCIAYRPTSECTSIPDSYRYVRPALKLKGGARANDLTVGDSFYGAGQFWKVISEDYALCRGFIGQEHFRSHLDTTSPDVWDYEKSDLKKFLKQWAKGMDIL